MPDIQPHSAALPPEGLGFIGFNGRRFIEASMNQNKRPSFHPNVFNVFPAGTQLDRCHSYSFEDMQQCLITILNRFPFHPLSADYIKSFMFVFYRLGNNTSRRELLYTSQQLTASIYAFAFNQGNLGTLLYYLNMALSALNSVTGNLRLPAAETGVHWNRSIQNNYDPRAWCYVRDDVVIADNNTQPNMPADLYFSIHAPNCPHVGNGFYLLDRHDHQLLSALADFNASCYGGRCARIVIASATVSDVPFLFSSSNTWDLPSTCQGFPADIYTQVWTQTHTDPDPETWRFVWRAFDRW